MSDQENGASENRAPNYVGEKFDPARYLTRIGGAEYLEVKWRLVWLRQQDPEATIDTSMVEHRPGEYAVFHARIVLSTGGSASGWATETFGDFRDYLEKAETKAIGRALAALGFGTQFTPDYDLEQVPSARGQTRIVDSPVDFASRAQTSSAQRPPAPAEPQTVTTRQLKFIQAISRESGMDEDAVRKDIQERFGCTPEDLGRREASEYIERLQSLRNTHPVTT